eukprot:scaffold74196_cov46-Phaeocystis_antarctica.AAC.1
MAAFGVRGRLMHNVWYANVTQLLPSTKPASACGQAGGAGARPCGLGAACIGDGFGRLLLPSTYSESFALPGRARKVRRTCTFDTHITCKSARTTWYVLLQARKARGGAGVRVQGSRSLRTGPSQRARTAPPPPPPPPRQQYSSTGFGSNPPPPPPPSLPPPVSSRPPPPPPVVLHSPPSPPPPPA